MNSDTFIVDQQIDQAWHYIESIFKSKPVKKWLKELNLLDWTPVDYGLLGFAAFTLLIFIWRWHRAKRLKLSRALPIFFRNVDGYIRVVFPSGRSQLEHRAIAEEVLGRRLERWEVVHHINGVRSDNRPENLCVMDRSAHESYHRWFDWIYDTYGRYPKRETQLQKLVEDFGGILLSGEFVPKRNRKI